jgi:hypothetical protein
VSYYPDKELFDFTVELPTTEGGYGHFSVSVKASEVAAWDTQTLAEHIRSKLQLYSIFNININDLQLNKLSVYGVNNLLISALEALLQVSTVEEAKQMLAVLETNPELNQHHDAKIGVNALNAYITAKEFLNDH